MTAESLLPVVLAIQGCLGAVDTLLNHELIARLRSRPECRGEVGLHALREVIYTVLFLGLAWFAWHGAAALAIAALLAAEVGVMACDEAVENRCRVLPQNERVLHVFMTMNYGVLLAVALPTLLDWGGQATAIVPAAHGWLAWLLTALAVPAALWAALDFMAWRGNPVPA